MLADLVKKIIKECSECILYESIYLLYLLPCEIVVIECYILYIYIYIYI